MDTVCTIVIAIIGLILVVLVDLILTKVFKKFKVHNFFKHDKTIMVLSYILGVALLLLLFKIFELIK